MNSLHEKWIFYPRKNDPALVEEWKHSKVVFHQTLQGWLIKNRKLSCTLQTTAPYILYYGGNAEDVLLNVYSLCQIQASSFLLMNYRGFGGTSGKPTQKNLFQDALTIYDMYVEQYQAPPEKIVLMGRSIGSSIAAYVASQRKVGGLILVTPFDSVQNVVKLALPWLPISWLFRNSFTTTEYLSRVSVKTLVLAAEQDEIIPQASLDALITAHHSHMTLKVIKEANHQDIHAYEEYYSAINQYLDRRLKGVSF